MTVVSTLNGPNHNSIIIVIKNYHTWYRAPFPFTYFRIDFNEFIYRRNHKNDENQKLKKKIEIFRIFDSESFLNRIECKIAIFHSFFHAKQQQKILSTAAQVYEWRSIDTFFCYRIFVFKRTQDRELLRLLAFFLLPSHVYA